MTDTVYVTENAWIKELSENDHNFNLHRIVVTENGSQKVYTEAECAYEKYDDKRIVVHFTRPHFPVMSDEYEKINDEWFCPNKPLNLWGNKLIDACDHKITRKDLLKAYKDNLEGVMTYVKKIVNNFNGKTVVSADHGQLFNERVAPIPIREWGHPKGSYADGILDVPWIVYNSNQRREIRSGENGNIVNKSNTGTKQRLKQLGYLQ